MNDRMLSQDEIEALIASLASEGGETPSETLLATPVVTKAVKDYDLRFPDKFSREHMRTFQVLYGQFARNLGATLSAFLRTSVQCAPRSLSR
jgi:flagellar motor switch protein FliM